MNQWLLKFVLLGIVLGEETVDAALVGIIFLAQRFRSLFILRRFRAQGLSRRNYTEFSFRSYGTPLVLTYFPVHANSLNRNK